MNHNASQCAATRYNAQSVPQMNYETSATAGIGQLTAPGRPTLQCIVLFQQGTLSRRAMVSISPASIRQETLLSNLWNTAGEVPFLPENMLQPRT